MAIKSLYFKNAAPAGASASLSLQDGGTAPTGALTATGWTVAKLAATNLSAMLCGTKRASTTFAASDAIPSFVASACFRSENRFNGTFANTNWSLAFRIRASVVSAQTGSIKVRIWKSVNADGTGATQLTSAVLAGTTTAVLSTSASATSTVTWTPGGTVVLNGEYIWVQCEWNIVATSASNTSDAIFYVESAGVVTTPDFVLGAISGTIGATEGSDVAAFAGKESERFGSLAAWEATTAPTADATDYFADSTLVTADAVNEGDTAVFAGDVTTGPVANLGTLAATESADTAAFTGTARMNAALAATEGADTASFAGTVGLIGTLAAVEGGAPSTWDTVNKSAITLSNGNLTATVTGAGGVLGNGSISSSKVYWEQTVTTWANNNTAVGVAQSNVNLGTVTSNTTRAATMGRTGSISINNVGTGVSLGTRANGNVIGIAVDPVAKLIWFRVAPAGLWNNSGTADPATGVGGLSISALTLPLFPLFCGIVANDACTANFGASAFSGAVPSGFAAGLSSIVGDTAAFTGLVSLTGTLAVTEGADSASFAGTVQWNAVLAATEGADTAAFTGTVAFVEITGTLAATENADTAVFAGTARTLATLAATEAADVAAFAGTVSVAITGVIAAIEGADTAAFTGQLGAVGTLAATEAGDVAAFAGHRSMADEKVGILDAHESGGAGGEIEPHADSTLVTADQTIFTADMDGRGGDQAYFVGEVGVGAVLAATEDADVASFVGIVPLPAVTGILAAQEAADAGRFYGDVVVEVPPWEAVEEGFRNEVQRTVWLAGQGGRVTWLENEVEETFSLQNLNPEVVFLENEVLRITELRP